MGLAGVSVGINLVLSPGLRDPVAALGSVNAVPRAEPTEQIDLGLKRLASHHDALPSPTAPPSEDTDSRPASAEERSHCIKPREAPRHVVDPTNWQPAPGSGQDRSREPDARLTPHASEPLPRTTAPRRRPGGRPAARRHIRAPANRGAQDPSGASPALYSAEPRCDGVACGLRPASQLPRES